MIFILDSNCPFLTLPNLIILVCNSSFSVVFVSYVFFLWAILFTSLFSFSVTLCHCFRTIFLVVPYDAVDLSHWQTIFIRTTYFVRNCFDAVWFILANFSFFFRIFVSFSLSIYVQISLSFSPCLSLHSKNTHCFLMYICFVNFFFIRCLSIIETYKITLFLFFFRSSFSIVFL